MACSDNVVRAGLTPKFIDKTTLCDMLTYKTGLPDVTKGDAVNDSIRVYPSPVPEFEVEALAVQAGKELALPARNGPSILLVVDGAATAALNTTKLSIGQGGVYLVGAHQAVTLTASAAGNVRAFRAFPNERL